jgi:hypothetical protein
MPEITRRSFITGLAGVFAAAVVPQILIPKHGTSFAGHRTAGGIVIPKKFEDWAVNYTRDKLREDSFCEKIISPIDISNDDLDRQNTIDFLVGKNRVAKKQLLDIYGLDYVKEMKKLRAV